MNHNKHLALILVQCTLILALAVTTAVTATESLAWTIIAALAASTILLLSQSIRSRAGIKQMAADLQRATSGNRRTRLLAKEDREWNEVIFAVNTLIEQLEQLQVSTIRSQTARKTLLSSISHDIRTPLASIIGYLDALKDGVPETDQERQQYLGIVSAKADALKEMIDDIFTMARLDADEMPLREEALDLAEIARETVIEFLPQFTKHGMEPHIRIPEHPCPVMADRLSITRIISNIIKNAVQHGHEGKTIGIELSEHESNHDHEYRLIIWDCGPGIAATDLPHVFERSFRGDQARSTRGGGSGSGLGLAIAKALTEKHHGRIWAESKPWERTTFVFTIPKREPF